MWILRLLLIIVLVFWGLGLGMLAGKYLEDAVLPKRNPSAKASEDHPYRGNLVGVCAIAGAIILPAGADYFFRKRPY